VRDICSPKSIAESSQAQNFLTAPHVTKFEHAFVERANRYKYVCFVEHADL